jgi:signal-transduction protein with cAMP-binding, CBS, and nucleotidyltransferase domain
MATEPRELQGDLAATAFVEASHLFKSLDPDARRDLQALARIQGWAPGDLVCGAADDLFLLVLDGSATIWGARGETPVELGTLERGGFHGESHVLGGGAAAAVVARTDLVAVVFPTPVVAAMAERFPKLKKLLETIKGAREKDAATRLGA